MWSYSAATIIGPYREASLPEAWLTCSVLASSVAGAERNIWIARADSTAAAVVVVARKSTGRQDWLLLLLLLFLARSGQHCYTVYADSHDALASAHGERECERECGLVERNYYCMIKMGRW